MTEPHPLRIAIVSTPRSGNTWLRQLLTMSLHVTSTAVHRPQDVDWERLPAGHVLQLHWHCDAELRSLLDRYGYHVVTIARHPFDVLLSILHFSQFEPQTAQWLDGLGGDERRIHGVTPLSDEFRKYALSLRAQLLLSVSREWWQLPEVCRTSYEDLVKDPVQELQQIFVGLNHSVRIRSVLAAANQSHFAQMKSTSQNCHLWQGQAGLWRRLLPAELVREFIAVHHETLKAYDYVAAPDLELDWPRALQHWQTVSSGSSLQFRT